MRLFIVIYDFIYKMNKFSNDFLKIGDNFEIFCEWDYYELELFLI